MQRRDELLLSEHFSEGVRRVRKNLPGSSLRVLNFDWHGMMKDLKEDATVEGFWSLLESFFPQVNFLHLEILYLRDYIAHANLAYFHLQVLGDEGLMMEGLRSS